MLTQSFGSPDKSRTPIAGQSKGRLLSLALHPCRGPDCVIPETPGVGFVPEAGCLVRAKGPSWQGMPGSTIPDTGLISPPRALWTHPFRPPVKDLHGVV